MVNGVVGLSEVVGYATKARKDNLVLKVDY